MTQTEKLKAKNSQERVGEGLRAGQTTSSCKLRRFLLFAWNSDERCGGWANFVDSFDTPTDAKKHYETAQNGKFRVFNDMYDIVDTHGGDKGFVVRI